MADTSTSTTCSSCKKTEEANGKTLLRCASCHGVSYCDRDCQKADWKSHKKDCTFQPKAKPTTPASGASSDRSPKTSMESLLGINTKAALQNKSEDQVFKLLVDSYRMRVEDEYQFRGDVHDDSAMGEGSPARGFRKYLKKAEGRDGLMPPWWSEEKREACIKFGKKKNHWWSLYAAPEKSDFQEQYNDGQMPMQLRMLGEEIVGSYVMGNGPGL